MLRQRKGNLGCSTASEKWESGGIEHCTQLTAAPRFLRPEIVQWSGPGRLSFAPSPKGSRTGPDFGNPAETAPAPARIYKNSMRRPDLNRGPEPYEGSALPDCATPRLKVYHVDTLLGHQLPFQLLTFAYLAHTAWLHTRQVPNAPLGCVSPDWTQSES